MPGRGSHFTQLFHHDTAQVIRERIVVLAAAPVISKRAHHLDAPLHAREIADEIRQTRDVVQPIDHEHVHIPLARREECVESRALPAVSYTHLTLPTSDLV